MFYVCWSEEGQRTRRARQNSGNRIPTIRPIRSDAARGSPYTHTHTRQARKRRQEEIHAAFRTKFLLTLGSVYVAVLAYVAYVVRQPYDAYPSGLARAARISPAVLVPVVGMSIYKIVEAVFGAMLRHTNKRIDKVNERSERIVQNLKDDMKFDRTEKLLRKYDREWVNPIGAAAGAGATGKGSSGSLHEAGDPEEIPAANAARTTMVTPTNAGLHTRSGSGKPPMSLSKKIMMSTVGGASMKLSGALAQLWTLTADTVIGDDPVLLRSLKNAEVHAQSLTEENSRLREKLERYESEFGIMEEVEEAAEGGEEDREAAADGRGGDDVDEASVEVKPLLLADDVGGGDTVGDGADDDDGSDDDGSGDDESDHDDDNEAIEMVVGEADEDGSNDDGSGEDDDDEEEAIEMVVGEAEEDPHAEEAQDDPTPSPPPRRSRRARTRLYV